MSILNVNKLAPIGSGSTITVAAGIASYTGKINCAEFDNNPSFTGNVTIGGNLGVAGTITYEDVARVDATGISTFREGYQVGPLTGIALTAYKDGSIRTTGIITASSFVGDVTGEVNASKFDTNPSGVVVTGVATATTFVPSEGQLSHRSVVYNGAMKIAQRGTSFTGITASGTFPVDRFRFHVGSLGTWTLSQSTDVPTGQGLGHSIKCDVTTANASPSGTAYARIDQRFEGQDLQRFCKGTSNAKNFAVSFWVKSPKTGTHIVQLQDQDNSRNVSKAYTVSSANTWEKKELIFPADTTGAFGNDAGGSLFLCIYLAVGTGYQGGTLQTTWGTPVNNTRATGQVNCADNTSNDFYLTGVQLEVGEVATPFEHRSYGEELLRCQRYYQTTYHGSTQDQPRMDLGFAASDTQIQSVHHYRTIMRDTPTPTQSGAFRVDGNTTKDVTSITFTYVSNVSAQVNYFTGAGLGANNPYIIRGHSDADARLNFDAEI